MSAYTYLVAEERHRFRAPGREHGSGPSPTLRCWQRPFAATSSPRRGFSLDRTGARSMKRIAVVPGQARLLAGHGFSLALARRIALSSVDPRCQRLSGIVAPDQVILAAEWPRPSTRKQTVQWRDKAPLGQQHSVAARYLWAGTNYRPCAHSERRKPSGRTTVSIHASKSVPQ